MESIGQRRRRLERDESGLTLVELLVVMLVMGILLVIAVPTFLNAQNGSKEAVAKSQAAQAAKTQKTVLLTDGPATADGAKLTLLKTAEPSLDFRLSDPSQAKVRGAVYLRQLTGETVELASVNGPDDCYWTRVAATGLTEFARGSCSEDPEALGALDWNAGW